MVRSNGAVLVTGNACQQNPLRTTDHGLSRNVTTPSSQYAGTRALPVVPPGLIDRAVRACGGAKGARTPDLNTASVALSQLSYSPLRYAPTDRSALDPLPVVNRRPLHPAGFTLAAPGRVRPILPGLHQPPDSLWRIYYSRSSPMRYRRGRIRLPQGRGNDSSAGQRVSRRGFAMRGSIAARTGRQGAARLLRIGPRLGEAIRLRKSVNV